MKIPSNPIKLLLSKFTFSLFLFFTSICTIYATPQTAFNVKEYGAKGDGNTLDTDAINNTITAAVKAFYDKIQVKNAKIMLQIFECLHKVFRG